MEAIIKQLNRPKPNGMECKFCLLFGRLAKRDLNVRIRRRNPYLWQRQRERKAVKMCMAYFQEQIMKSHRERWMLYRNQPFHAWQVRDPNPVFPISK